MKPLGDVELVLSTMHAKHISRETRGEAFETGRYQE